MRRLWRRLKLPQRTRRSDRVGVAFGDCRGMASGATGPRIGPACIQPAASHQTSASQSFTKPEFEAHSAVRASMVLGWGQFLVRLSVSDPILSPPGATRECEDYSVESRRSDHTRAQHHSGYQRRDRGARGLRNCASRNSKGGSWKTMRRHLRI